MISGWHADARPRRGSKVACAISAMFDRHSASESPSWALSRARWSSIDGGWNPNGLGSGPSSRKHPHLCRRRRLRNRAGVLGCWIWRHIGCHDCRLHLELERKNWVRSPSPTLPSLSFEGVACADPQDCWAVGYYYAGTPYLNPDDADSIIERWDGASWTVLSAPTGTELSGVTCASVSSCWAVGSSIDRHRWPEPTPVRALGRCLVECRQLPEGALNDALDTVTCVTTTDCWAGGSSGNISDPSDPGGLIEGWNGTAWMPYVGLDFVRSSAWRAHRPPNAGP